jgi:hypothetical protein
MVAEAAFSFFVPRLLSNAIGVTPVPLSATVCGFPGALSLTKTAAERAPDPVGVNETEIVQFAPGASVLGATGQVFVCAKSPAFAPVTPIELIVSAPVPELVNVTFWAALVVPISWLPKPRLVGENVTAGVGATPVPLSATACGFPGALSVIVTEAVRAPAAVGAKVAEIVQLAPGASVLGLSGQLLSWTKSPALAPPTPMLVITSGAFPEFSKVELWAVLEVPTS